MNTRNILIALIIIITVVIGVGFGVYYIRHTPVATRTSSEMETVATSTKPSEANTTSSVKFFSRDKAWSTFASYLSKLKAHDIEGVKALSYQQSATCQDTSKQKECFAIMDNVYNLAWSLKRDDFTHVVEDSKQMIISTEPFKDSVGTTTVGLLKSYVFFTKTDQGDFKIISLDPGKGVYRVVGSSEESENAYREIRTVLRDGDDDGLYDNEENCVGDYAESGCVKTDPNMRDSNGNGWWDGVESFFVKK